MKKLIFTLASFLSVAMLCSCGDENEVKDPELPGESEVSFYQCDSMISVNTEGTEVARYEFKYDERGNIVWERWFNVSKEQNDIVENTYDDQGRYTKQMAYWEGDGLHELYLIFDFFYGTNDKGLNYRLIYTRDVEGKLLQKDSTVYDAEGKSIQDNVFYTDEDGTLYHDYYCDKTYNEHNDIVKKVYLSPVAPDYYCEQIKNYEYKTFGDLTQYTSIDVKYSWDGTNFYKSNKEIYGYDAVGNNLIEELYNYSNETDEPQLNCRYEYTVDSTLLTKYTYGVDDYYPKQPNCYSTYICYDAAGNEVESRRDYYSVHHTEKEASSQSRALARRMAPASSAPCAIRCQAKPAAH